MKHAMNCGAAGFDGFDAGECTCGLEWRIKLGTEQEMHVAWRKRAEDAEKELAEIKTAANVLIDYCEAHNWGIMPEPFDSINPLLKLLGRAAESAAIPPAPQKVEDFDAWWERDGKFFDPDTDDVPWFDKRKFLAEYAWHRRGARNA